jgi:hypothetical protein
MTWIIDPRVFLWSGYNNIGAAGRSLADTKGRELSFSWPIRSLLGERGHIPLHCELDHIRARQGFRTVIQITIAFSESGLPLVLRQPLIFLGAAPKSEAQMRKNTSFALAATMLGVAMFFWAKSSVVATTAEMARPRVGMSFVSLPGLFLPVKAVEPIL